MPQQSRFYIGRLVVDYALAEETVTSYRGKRCNIYSPAFVGMPDWLYEPQNLP